jgi:hypothetical protein
MTWMRKYLPFFLSGLGLIIFLGAAGFLISPQKAQRPKPAVLPEMILDLPLSESIQSEAAIAEIARMHGNDFDLTSAAIGMYGADYTITLWIAEVSTQTGAGQMLMAMRDKIANSAGSSPFEPVAERSDGSRTVYELEGMGQKHFYYQSGKLVVWLAVQPESAEVALNQILKFYP